MYLTSKNMIILSNDLELVKGGVTSFVTTKFNMKCLIRFHEHTLVDKSSRIVDNQLNIHRISQQLYLGQYNVLF